MKHNALSTALCIAMVLMGCGSDSKESVGTGKSGETSGKPGNVSHENKTISGVSQKGPFITGSSVTVQELNGESLVQTGISFKGKISSDRGEFSVATVMLASQYVFLEVNGFYRNEFTGRNSDAPIIMNAVADISDRDNVNVNLLTHLETDRVMHLVTVDGKPFADAKTQARDELMQAFGFSGNFDDAEDMNIFGNDDSSAALLAISIVAQGNLTVGDFSERIARISSDFADGSIDNNEIWNQMANWAVSANLGQIRQNIENWGEHVPDFEKYVKMFWKEKLGLGTCEHVGEIKENSAAYLICRNDGWDYPTKDEIIAFFFGKCDTDGDVKNFEPKEYLSYEVMVANEEWYNSLAGWYMCQNNDWNKTSITALEHYYLGSCNNDNRGEIKYYNGKSEIYSEGYYICEPGWRAANEEEIDRYLFGSCSEENQNEIKCIENSGCGFDCSRCDGLKWHCTNYADSLPYLSGFGVCGDDNRQEVKCAEDSELGIFCSWCLGNMWYTPSDGCEFNLITQLGTCNEDNNGEIKRVENSCFGDKHYVCRDIAWFSANFPEFSEYYLGKCTAENLGEIKVFGFDAVGINIYPLKDVFQCRNNNWGSMNYDLGDCNEENLGEIKHFDGEVYDLPELTGEYQCIRNEWVNWALAMHYYLGECNDQHVGEIKHFDPTTVGLPEDNGLESHDWKCEGGEWGEVSL